MPGREQAGQRQQPSAAEGHLDGLIHALVVPPALLLPPLQRLGQVDFRQRIVPLILGIAHPAVYCAVPSHGPVRQQQRGVVWRAAAAACRQDERRDGRLPLVPVVGWLLLIDPILSHGLLRIPRCCWTGATIPHPRPRTQILAHHP